MPSLFLKNGKSFQQQENQFVFQFSTPINLCLGASVWLRTGAQKRKGYYHQFRSFLKNDLLNIFSNRMMMQRTDLGTGREGNNCLLKDSRLLLNNGVWELSKEYWTPRHFDSVLNLNEKRYLIIVNVSL